MTARLAISGGQLVGPSYTNGGMGQAGNKVAPRNIGQRIEANLLPGANSSAYGASSVMAFGAPGYTTFLQGFVPDTIEQSLVPHYREIYYYDNVAGSAVDLKSTFPFSAYTLVGLESKELYAFSESLSRLNLRQLFQEASVSMLVDSTFVGSLIFEPSSKVFKDVLMHDYLSCQISPKPFHSIDPLVRVDSSSVVQRFLGENPQFVNQLMAGYPERLIESYASGPIDLDPLTTLYIARRGGRAKTAVSYLKRILPVYLLDKVLYRGTLMEANRRQRSTTHIMAGDENWIPTDSELENILMDFQKTDLDPLGAWIVTRNGLTVQDVRMGGDFWKWTETFDILTPYKLRSLGISEAFLSGDASYSTAEAALSIFLQDADAHRQEMTYALLTNKVFPILAVLHGLFKDPSKAKDSGTNEGLSFNLNNQSNLKIPTLRWHKSLDNQDPASQMDMLDKLTEKGFNIPMKMLAAAANVDIGSLLTEMEEDIEVRKKMQALSDRIKAEAPSTEDEGGEGSNLEFSAMPRTMASGVKRKMPLLSRDQSDSKPIGILSKSGNKIHAVPNERAFHRKMNENIVKAMQSLSDPNRKASVAKMLAEKKAHRQ